jgi:hypothetical protein
VRTGIVDPTERAIAIVAAYQLWLDSGCPIGSDQEHWFRAEAILRNALGAMFEELSRRASIPQCVTLADSGIVAEFTWDGHWEVWEREWGSARWVSDVDDPGAPVSKRAA